MITTPDERSRKEYIGNAAAHASMAVVFAQLEIDGASEGVHAFVVPIRDGKGKPMPGVRIGDDGAKIGLNGVDNGRLWFDGVRVPRTSLLNRYADVTEDGRYVSDIDNPDRRFFTMLGTLIQGRVSVGGAAITASKVALAVAVKYANLRRQFGSPGHRRGGAAARLRHAPAAAAAAAREDLRAALQPRRSCSPSCTTCSPPRPPRTASAARWSRGPRAPRRSAPGTPAGPSRSAARRAAARAT